MTRDTATMLRLRRANPAAPDASTDEALYRSIVSTPGDPRLASISPDRPRGHTRRYRIAIAAAALCVGAGAAWAATGGALQLFRSNPQADGAGPSSLWSQEVIPESVALAATVPIPAHGPVEFWYGETREGGWCGAIRLPDGTWAGTKGSAAAGTAAGCYPTREQINGDDPVFVITGFDYYEIQVDARKRGGAFWRVYYGVLSLPEPVSRVADGLSGREAEVFEGKAFVLAVPDAQPERAVPLAGQALDLVAYDAAGEPVAREHPPRR